MENPGYVRDRQRALAPNRMWNRMRKDIIYKESRNKRRGKRLPPVEPVKESLISSGELDEELLPGIANEITLIHIFPKLPWRDFLVLSSVCRGWKRALRSGHRYYDERVRSNSTEALAVVDVILPHDDSHVIALYSVREERFYHVPPIPGFSGFPLGYECVSLDGKLYVLGGLNYSCKKPINKEVYVLDKQTISKAVYVLDLVGERQWRQCESMRNRRQEFGCVVMDGKIYVFGGTFGYEPVAGAEVYDPKLNSWSTIPDYGVCRFQNRVTVVGEELVLRGGMSYGQAHRAYLTCKSFLYYSDIDFDTFWARHPLSNCTYEALRLEFYNPITKQIRSDYRFGHGFDSTRKDIVSGPSTYSSKSWKKVKFFVVSWDRIEHHLVNDDNGVILRKFADYSVLPPDGYVLDNEPFVVTVVDDELLAVVHWVDQKMDMDGSCLVRSRGYSTEENVVVWEKAPCFGKHSSSIANRIKCSIQL